MICASGVKSEPAEKKPVPESSLEQRVQDLVSLICDIKVGIDLPPPLLFDLFPQKTMIKTYSLKM